MLIGQSGGVTAVINSSLAGAISAAQKSGKYNTIYGMRGGIEGFMKGELADLTNLSEDSLRCLANTPSSALGSCRYKLQDNDIPKIASILNDLNISAMVLIGGNDTMDTIHRVEAYCRDAGHALCGIGVPKTVDNDLYGTDHTPGYGSAARYVALSIQQAGRLAEDMRRVDKYSIYQTVGRDTGWLAAAAALSKKEPRDPPHIVWLPERPISRKTFCDDVQQAIERYGWCSAVVGEGALWDNGAPVSSSGDRDRFGNMEFGAMSGASAAIALHSHIHRQTGFRGEFQVPESLMMCADDRVSQIDREEAFACGEQAAKLALENVSGVMVSIERVDQRPYRVEYRTVPLREVANNTKPLPDHFIGSDGISVTQACVDYIRPLAGELPIYQRV